MKHLIKTLTFAFLCFCNLFIYGQDTLNKSSIEVHELNGFRFELHHQSTNCPACEICICKEVLVYDSKGKLIHNQIIRGNTEFPNRMVDKMDVYDFNFDGYPDFRLVDFEVFYDSYYIYQPTSENYLFETYLSQCTNVHFYQNEKEVIGFYHASLALESKNLKTSAYLNSHRFHFKGKNLEQLTIESKVWYNPWNGPAFYEDTISPKYLHTRTCSYKNFVLEQIGDEVITTSEFSPIPLSKDSINLRTKVHHYQALQPKIQYYDQELPNNYTLYKDRAKDTVINKKHYSWVVYDLNQNPFEIGENYTNGIKNGEWIKRDQHGRIVSIEKYLNDTLCGMADYYYYPNYPWNVTRISGLNLKGCKVGDWTYFQSGKFKSLEGKWTKDVVKTYNLSGMLISRSDFSSKERIESIYYYSLKNDEIWFISFDKKGRIIESIPQKEKVKSFDLLDN